MWAWAVVMPECRTSPAFARMPLWAALVAVARRAAVAPRALGESAAPTGPVVAWAAVMPGCWMPLLLSRMSPSTLARLPDAPDAQPDLLLGDTGGVVPYLLPTAVKDVYLGASSLVLDGTKAYITNVADTA